MGWSRPTINIFFKTKSLRTEDDAVRLLGSGGCHLLRAVNLVKLLMLTATTNNWSNCTVLCMKKGHIIGKDMTSWFSSTTTHYRTRQQWPKTTCRYSTGKCYPIPLTHQTWHLLTVFICFRRWATSSLRFLRRHGLMICLERNFHQRMRNFFGVVYTNCPKNGKNV